MRQAALIVIANYVQPGISGVVGIYDRRGALRELMIKPTRISHGDQEQGEQPVPQNIRSRVESILTRLVSTKPGALEDLARALLAEIAA
jgi:hypothetical protein